MLDALRMLFCLPQQPPVVQWTYGPVLNLVIARSPIIYQLQDGQKSSVTIDFKTLGGNPATVDGVPAWTVSNPEILDLSVSADGLTATFSAKGPLGSCFLNLTADADLSEGVRNIIGQSEVVVVAGDAAVVNFTFGVAEPK